MLIRGQEVKEGPTEYPANPKMYNMIKAQAAARFTKQEQEKKEKALKKKVTTPVGKGLIAGQAFR